MPSSPSIWAYAPQLPTKGLLTLEHHEAQHLVRVRRGACGDVVTMFDGRGHVGEGVVREIDRRSRTCVVEVVSRVQHPGPPPRLHICAALPKGDRASTMISMATQLGIASYQPLETQFSVVKASPKRTQRGARVAIEACKQARWPWVPEVLPATTIASLCALLADGGARHMPTLVAHPSGAPIRVVMRDCAGEGPIRAIVGPEGGLTDEEVAMLTRTGSRVVDLGPRILRIETAVVALAAAHAMFAS